MISKKFILKLCTAIEKKIKRKGVFLEAGANDGITQSNTLVIEKKLKWSGILIEPLPSKLSELKKNRPLSKIFNVALSNNSSLNSLQLEILDGDRGLMSRILGSRSIIKNSKNNFFSNMLNYFKKKNIIIVPVKTLDNLLNKNFITQIDFMSLDVEGYEHFVLEGFEIKKFQPIAVLVEIWSDQFDNIVNYFLKNNYFLVKNVSNFNLSNNPNWSQNHNDYLFLKKEHINIIRSI
jgi:FkbM family methyltransferase